MPKQQTDHLVQLVNSLTKSEKRHFRLWVNRNQPTGELLFLQLFDFLDKQNKYDEGMILKKIPKIKKRQLSNLKAHLYKQLLLSLRLLHRQNNTDIEVRERIDYGRVLYNKGLYRQALEMLDKAKSLAENAHLDALLLEILEFEKHIEVQHITRSIDNRAETLSKEALIVSQKTASRHLFSNLAIQLYGLYLKVGYVRNQKEYYFVREFFQSNLPKYELRKLSFFEKMYLYQSYSWYHFMIQDFLNYYKYAQKWVDAFHRQPEMIELELPLYLKAQHNLLNALYLAQHSKKFKKALKILEDFAEERYKKGSVNVDSLLYLFLYIHRINKHVLEGTFTEGLNLVPKLEKQLKTNAYNWDSHRIMVFNYKIACLYFSCGDFDNAITYLNEIINQKNPDFREDIQCFSRILCLIAHFELGNNLLVEYQVKSVYRFLNKMEDLQQVQKEILKFIRKIPRLTQDNIKHEFVLLKETLIKVSKQPFEKRPFLYLDIISWLESHIEGVTPEKVIRRKALKRKK